MHQGGESSERLFLMAQSTSVVTFAAHPLGQQMLAERGERHGTVMRRGKNGETGKAEPLLT